MKKLFALVMIVCMMFSMAACGGGEDEKTLKVALSPDFAPMEFVDSSKSGQESYVGFDVTLAKYIADGLGMELEIVPMSFDACQVAVETGAVDMSISGYSYTDDRAQLYNLSDFYYAGDNETEQVIITTKENAGKWTKASDFSGKKVAAQTASLQMDLCKAQLPKDCEIVEVADLTTAFLQLQNGDFDAMAVAKGNGKMFIQSNPDAADYTGFEFEITKDQEANLILMQKGDDELTEQVNELLQQAYDAGYYGEWYEEAEELASQSTSTEVTYDDEGNAVEDEE